MYKISGVTFNGSQFSKEMKFISPKDVDFWKDLRIKSISIELIGGGKKDYTLENIDNIIPDLESFRNIENSGNNTEHEVNNDSINKIWKYIFAVNILIILLTIGFIIYNILKSPHDNNQWLYLGIIIVSIIGILTGFEIYLKIFFSSTYFRQLKVSIYKYAKNCNDLNEHIERLKCSYLNIKSYDYGDGQLIDNSKYQFKRNHWGNIVKNNQVHNCSASVCKNASDQPFKYICKYFDVKVNDESLSNYESVLNDFSAVEQGKILLKNERYSIISGISNAIPSIILYYREDTLYKQLGFEEIDLSDLYFPVFTFQYVSAGGNSSINFNIRFDIDNLNKFIMYLGDLVKFKKSVHGQRLLMTSSLREKIIIRDKYSCKKCGLSINDEKNLLLEIDHIIPLSKGGITSEDNLQTLCWKCNRSKGSKIVDVH